MRPRLLPLILLACAIPVAYAQDVVKDRIVAFCGSASEAPMNEASAAFTARTGIKVDLVWGGSGSVLSQMKLSRRGDLYIPGSPDFMDRAIRDGLIDSSSIRVLSYLVPVIAVQKGNPLGIRGLADLSRPGLRIAIGNPETVCVGLYAIEIFERNGIFSSIKGNIVTHAASCSDVASLIALQKVDAVIGWDVFASWNPTRIDTVALSSAELPRLAYIPAALTRDFCQNRAGAQAFLDYLVSPEGRAIFAKWGYITNESEARKHAPSANIGGEYVLPPEAIPGSK